MCLLPVYARGLISCITVNTLLKRIYGTEQVDRPVYDLFLKGRMGPSIKVVEAHPLPQETKTFESWAPLNKKAVHVAPDFTNPWDEAGTPSRTGAAGSVSSMLAEQQTRQMMRDQVRRIYGQQGVDALPSATR